MLGKISNARLKARERERERQRSAMFLSLSPSPLGHIERKRKEERERKTSWHGITLILRSPGESGFCVSAEIMLHESSGAVRLLGYEKYFTFFYKNNGHGDGMDARDARGTPGACRGEKNCMGLWNILGCETGFIQHGGRRLGVRRRDELSYAGTLSRVSL
jgi:hypothetical protein